MIKYQLIGKTAPAHPCARGISASMHVIDVRGWKAPDSEPEAEVA